MGKESLHHSQEADEIRKLRNLAAIARSSFDEFFSALDKNFYEQENRASTEQAKLDEGAITVTPDVLDNLIDKLQNIDEKLRDFQTQHFELQHSCASATEIARAALSNSHMGNPYLAKIDSILSHNDDRDTVEDILSEAKTMINGAANDVVSIARSVFTETNNEQSQSETTSYSDLSSMMDVQLNDLDAILEARKLMKRKAAQAQN